MDADGSNIRQVTHESGYHWSLQPTWSPDGTRLAYAHGVAGACCHIAVVDLDGSNQHEITTDNPDGTSFVADAPTWSPDGRSIAFVGDATGEDVEIYAVAPDGSGLRRITDNPDGVSFGPAWSPDGGRLAFVAQRADGSAQLDLVGADRTNLVELPDGDATAWDGHPAWSPDGSQLVFESMRDGSPTTDLYVINTDGTDLKSLIQTDDVFETDASWGR
jgi:TolB protein